MNVQHSQLRYLPAATSSSRQLRHLGRRDKHAHRPGVTQTGNATSQR